LGMNHTVVIPNRVSGTLIQQLAHRSCVGLRSSFGGLASLR